MLEDSPIQTIQDIAGKTVAVNTLGAHLDYTVREALHQQGLPQDAANLIVVPGPQLEQVLRSNQVDVSAFGYWQTTFTGAALQNGGLRAVFDDTDVLGEIAGGFIVLRRDWIEAHPEEAKAFVEGSVKALDYARENPEETKAIRREVRAFCDEVLAPVAHRLNTTPESRDSFPRELFRAMADAGLYRIPFPADVGGRGLEFPTLATLTVLEEIAYYSPGLASALYDGQAILVGKTLERAQEPLRSRYLSALVRGEFVGAFATSEPDASTTAPMRPSTGALSTAPSIWRTPASCRWPPPKAMAWSVSESASRMEPRAARASRRSEATSAGTDSACSTCCRCEATVSGAMGRRLNCRQRDSTVTGTFCGSVVASTNLRYSGGSSSVFNMALNAVLVSMCTSSIMKTLKRPCTGL